MAYFCGCVYRNQIYRPYSVAAYGGAGNELKGNAVITLGVRVQQTQSQQITDNIIWDARTPTANILELVAEDQKNSNSVYARNKYYVQRDVPFIKSGSWVSFSDWQSGTLNFDFASQKLTSPPWTLNPTTGNPVWTK